MPACLFQSPSLQQLSLADNRLSGPFPPLPPDCALKLLDVSANRLPEGRDIHPGIQVRLGDAIQVGLGVCVFGIRLLEVHPVLVL